MGVDAKVVPALACPCIRRSWARLWRFTESLGSRPLAPEAWAAPASATGQECPSTGPNRLRSRYSFRLGADTPDCTSNRFQMSRCERSPVSPG
jgi:hypothetical protein